MYMTLFCLVILFVTHVSLFIHAVRVADDLAAVVNVIGLAALAYVSWNQL